MPIHRALFIVVVLSITTLLLLTSGCDKISGVSDKSKITGNWKAAYGATKWEFYSNGDARFHGVLSNNRGHWKILTGNRIEIRWDDALVEPIQEFKYSFIGKKLVLTGSSIAYELEPQ